jgi:sulfide:quinone oxidoreductase
MKRLLVLGAGTAGTIVANKLRHKLPTGAWEIVVVDQDDDHLYQPGLLLMPFGVYTPDELVRSRRSVLSSDIRLVRATIDRVRAADNQVDLTDGQVLDYDELVIATGVAPRPDQTPGMTAEGWRTSIHEFYTLEGSIALRDALATFDGGRLVVHVVEMPIKCPVAPLEFAFLVDAFLEEKGLRNRVDLVYVTPLDGAFTKPVAAKHLGNMLADRHIALETDFVVDRVDGTAGELVSMDERTVPFDLLLTIPLNMGADYVARSGLGNELNLVPVNRHTSQSLAHPNVFALGDASDLPTSKAGSVAHFSAELFVENFLDHIADRPMLRAFDGHANCFIESGHGKGLLLDFNYDTEPLPGKYPLAGVGPFSLLAESRVNHWGKLGFRWAYWHLLLPGRPMPVPALMTMAGKHPAASTHSS